MRNIAFPLFLLQTLSHAAAQTVTYRQVSDVSCVASADTSAYRKERCKLDIYYPLNAGKPFKTVVWSWPPTTGCRRGPTTRSTLRMPRRPWRGPSYRQ